MSDSWIVAEDFYKYSMTKLLKYFFSTLPAGDMSNWLCLTLLTLNTFY